MVILTSVLCPHKRTDRLLVGAGGLFLFLYTLFDNSL